ncbi:M48 family metallopeptidase [Candidatus Ruthturnera calyptogenae]|nr:SprT family zinc-dependent metalloprotease [Candidatus Ruthturnera calyptogenae]
MKYQLIRSKRKTLSLQISDNAELLIRTPNRLSIKKIESFIREKQHWIEKKQALIKNTKRKMHYHEDEDLLYLGNTYPLKLIHMQKPQIHFDGTNFYLSGDGKTHFHTWYKNTFRNIALPRLDYYADLHQLNYKKVYLKAQKTKWGSCSHVNNINLNYLLIMAPMNVIDYVIVHELAHIKHKHHQSEFWQLVKSILPNYHQAKNWLKEQGHQLRRL